MKEIEEEALSTCELVPQFWKRYVDDTLRALPADAIGHFSITILTVSTHTFNSVEAESNNSLLFLDVLLTHESDSSITTSVYRKPTHADKYLDFSSHCNIRYLYSGHSLVEHRCCRHHH